MAGTGGASSMVELESEGSRIESSDSEIRNKRIKSGKEEEDRFSALPDFLIRRILSLLPATDLVKTLFLSKWWKYQWTLVPVLEFVASDSGMSPHKFSNFIDKTLIFHNSPNLDKFVIDLRFISKDDEFPRLDSWIRFAVRRKVKALIVHFNDDIHKYLLPKKLFNNSSFVTLKFSACEFMPIRKVNWGSLKSLGLYGCGLENEEIGNVLSGSPLLEYLYLCGCQWYDESLVICSKSLKTLKLDGSLCDCWNDMKISCPNLERLRISNVVWFRCFKLIDLPSSVYAAFDIFLEEDNDMSHDDCLSLVQQILRQVEHVEKLEIGEWMMKILLSSKEDGDCIGGLPDPFIQRIISFIPPTKQVFKTDAFSGGQREWTDVSILNFVSNDKLVIDSKDIPLADLDPRLSLWIRFAVRKDVKELILNCDGFEVEFGNEYPLPQFLFNSSSLVKMKICACKFMPNGKVNWECLKSLQLDYSELGSQAIEHVLSGSPLLESLELNCCEFQEALVIASENLKTCLIYDFGTECRLIEISCPKLESLKIWGNLCSASLKLRNLPASLHATLNFYFSESDDTSRDECLNLVEEIREQILHVEELEIELKN